MTQHDRLGPAFYGSRSSAGRSVWRDWWLLLHPPYTLWHLSYVMIGACLSPDVDGGRLAATLIAFFLAVGLGAHALDELHGRPLRTEIPGWVLAGAATASLAGAVALGIAGVADVGVGLVAFIVIGVVLAVSYNLELFGGVVHNDFGFALAWGAFPVLTAYYAQAETVGVAAVIAAVGAFGLSRAQRALSSRARELRRKVSGLEGTVTYRDGQIRPLDVVSVLAPIETALKWLAWSTVAFAAAIAVFRFHG